MSHAQFMIKNIEFIECFSEIDKTKDIEVYRFIEKLVYGEIPQEKVNAFSKQLKEVGIINFVNTVKSTIPKLVFNDIKNKRKNIKENMIENYVIKNNKNKKFLQDLNLKIFLKTIPNKNITIEDGDIIEIKFS